MSSTQSFSLSFTSSNASTYLTGNNATIGGSYVAYAKAFNTGYATFNSTAMDALYPNSTAHPTKADVSMTHNYLGVDRLQFAGTQISSAADGKTTTETRTDSVVLNSTKSTVIRYVLDGASAWGQTRLKNASITLYFTRYDFTATAGSNVTAASVSSSTGYDGDTITYSCTLASGATFDGWYNGSTRVSTSQSYTHTVSGSDLALTAKASMPVTTKTLSATYNNAQISGFPKSTQSAVALTYGGTSKGSIPLSGGTKTFECGGKLTASAIGIGGTTLNNSGKMMATDVVVTVS